jgi:hypothetical protein
MAIKRLDLLDDASLGLVSTLLQHCPPPGKPARRQYRKTGALFQQKAARKPRQKNHSASKNIEAEPRTDFESLADALIEKCCGSHSLGLIYDFLLRMTGDPKAARSEFVKFLSGGWSQEWVQAAATDFQRFG